MTENKNDGWAQLHSFAQKANEREITRLTHLCKMERERGDLFEQKARELEERANLQRILRDIKQRQVDRWHAVATALLYTVARGTVVFTTEQDRQDFDEAKARYHELNGDDNETPA